MLIKNGIVIKENGCKNQDLRLDGGKIVQIGENLCPAEQEEVLDASGYYVMPGGVDVHTHLDMPAGAFSTSDDYLAGTKAAVMGGTTTIMDFAEYDSGEKLQDGLDRWHEKAEGKSYCDYGFHMTVSDWDETTGEQIASIRNQGVTSFKSYTAYKDNIGVDDAQLFRILKCMKEMGTLLCVHCENGDMLECLQEELRQKDSADIRNYPKSRPNLVEKEAVSKVIDMAAVVGVPVYIVHVSTREAMEVIGQARKRGQKVYAETCPQYLLLDEGKYDLPGFESAKYVLAPPLRSQADQEALWEALENRRLDVVSTDHCSFYYEGQKSLGKEDFTGIAGGVPGVENRMELMLEYGSRRGLSLEEILRYTATEPAKIFGMYPQKGTLREGSDADIILVKKGEPRCITMSTQHQKVDYTPYEGMEVSYRVTDVFVGGKRAVANGQWILEKPEGKFVECRCL